MPPFDAAGIAMWQLAERYTGRVGYQRGIKAEGLSLPAPVIDCSGWVAALLKAGLQAVERSPDAANSLLNDLAEPPIVSEYIISMIERRSGHALAGGEITEAALPRFATIGLRQGGGEWAQNYPRPRGITHIVQVLRRPGDGLAFVSEAQGWAEPTGLRLLPLTEWLQTFDRPLADVGAWAVDAFAAAISGRQ